MQLEGPEAIVLEGAEVHGDGVGGAADHLAFDQERVVGQDGQGGAIHPSDGEQLPLGQVHALHLGTAGQTGSETGGPPRQQPLRALGTSGPPAISQRLRGQSEAIGGGTARIFRPLRWVPWERLSGGWQLR